MIYASHAIRLEDGCLPNVKFHSLKTCGAVGIKEPSSGRRGRGGAGGSKNDEDVAFEIYSILYAKLLRLPPTSKSK